MPAAIAVVLPPGDAHDERRVRPQQTDEFALSPDGDARRGIAALAKLIDECLAFARSAGYRTVTLWTQSILTSARYLYVAAGFRLVKSEPHESFGAKLVGETWELALED